MENFYFNNNDQRLFGVLHRPAGTVRTGLVLCLPYGEELTRSYARFARWSKQLAEDGIAVLRFHYRGTGESSGPSSAFDLHAACSDTLAAVQCLRDRVQTDQIALLGFRFGATVAARAAVQARPNALLLWVPILNSATYLREILRLRITKELIHQRRDKVTITSRDLVQQLKAGKAVDLLGHDLSPALYRHLRETNPWERPPTDTPVLWLARSQDPLSGQEQAAAWRRAGVSVDFRAVSEIIFWEEFPPDLPARFASESLAWLAAQKAVPTLAGGR